MPLLSLHEYKTMPYPERCQRIGDLLGKAAVRYFRQQRLAKNTRLALPANVVTPVEIATLVSDETEKRILQYVSRTGSATPHDLCVALDVNRRTITRKLARLRTSGILVAQGRTNAARYEFRGPLGEN
jgi:predicted HTH transcriptional regulator